jgi:hypothetical protein
LTSLLGYQSLTVQSIEAESMSSDISVAPPDAPLLSLIDLPGCIEILVIGAQ